MKLIQKPGTRKSATGIKSSQSWGLFECPHCKNSVEKRLGHGKAYKSCGCVSGRLSGKSHETHGDASHDSKYRHLYHSWISMKSRCSNPKNHKYKYYGRHSIKVCENWMDYLTFKKWALANGYKRDMELDRQDNNKGYEPVNCRYVISAVNRQNQSNTKLSSAKIRLIRRWYSFGYYSRSELAVKFKVSYDHICQIITFRKWANVCPGIID